MLIIQEHKSSSYAHRTYLNAASADLTIAVAVDYSTAGEKLTKKAAKNFLELPFKDDFKDNARILYKCMKRNNYTSLNIAGNGIYTFSKHGVEQEDINQYIYDMLSLVHTHLGISFIVPGGQTGTDIAGGVAGYALDIHTTMTLPNGFKQRFKDGIDITQTEGSVLRQVEYWDKLLNKEKK